MNAQTKPKVSSPAPPKIYGRPGTLSTDPIKSDLKNVNELQNRTLNEPPPAHSFGRKYLPPQQPGLFDLPAATPAPLSHSPGIHTPNSLAMNVLTTTIQSKPLDLGLSGRHRSPNSPTPTLSPAISNEPIALDITNIPIRIKCNATESTDLGQHLALIPPETSIKIPTITMTPDAGAVPSPQTHPSTPNRLHEIDETSNLSDNSKCDSGKTDMDFVSNGIANNTSKNVCVVTATPTIQQPSNNIQPNPMRTNSADGFLRSSSTNSSPVPSPVPSPNSAQSAPATPNKCSNDYEKSSSPGNRIH